MLSVLEKFKKIIEKNIIESHKGDTLPQYHKADGLLELMKEHKADFIQKKLDAYVSYLNQSFKGELTRPLEKLTRELESPLLYQNEI
jgi:hypothetical protein